MFNETPLHYAANNGHLRVVEYLVNQNADINAKDNDMKTPLGLASESGEYDDEYDNEYDKKSKSKVVEFLKSKGGQ